jgi:hypothetical protein
MSNRAVFRASAHFPAFCRPERIRLTALVSVRHAVPALRFALVLAAAALVVVVAGCGGTTPSAQETWAESVCAPVVQWRDDVSKIGSDVKAELTSPTSTRAAAVSSSVTAAEQSTSDLISDLKTVGPPPDANGDSADRLLTQLSSNLQQTLTTVENEAQQLGNQSLGDAIVTLGQIGSNVSGAIAQAQSTLQSIGESGSSLQKGFDRASSCKKLRND